MATTLAKPCGSVAVVPHEGDSVPQAIIPSLLAKGVCAYQIPEFHDEQRLRVGHVGYGALVTSFATPLDTLRDSSAFDGKWVNVAVVSVVELGTWQVPHEYRHLHLLVGTNCLFLKHFATSPVWRAEMLPGSGASACPAPPSADVGNLPVYADAPVADIRDLPPVTRFSEDVRDSTAIGVPCGNAWCYVGIKTGNDLPPSFFASVTGIQSARTQAKGWYDEQHLAMPDISQVPPIRSEALAAAIPVDTLATMKFAPGTWSQVAVVVFKDVTSGKYGAGSQAYGFEGNGKANKVWLRQVVGVGGKATWDAYIGDAMPTGKSFRRLQVVRTDHSATPFTVPGTARWRFVDDDEKLWVACLQGCCMVVPRDA